MSTLTRDRLVTSLQQLTTSGGADNHLVVVAGDYYVVVHGRLGGSDLAVEVVSNFYLGGPAQLTPARLRSLGDRGYFERSGYNNLFRDVRLTGPDPAGKLADELLALFSQIFGIEADAPANFELQLGDPEPTRNPDLVRAMKALAVRRDMDARQRVYVAVMNATFLMPINPAGRISEEPLEVDRLGNFPVIAAFTEADSLRLWQPKGWPFALVPGSRLVPLAVSRRVGSLLLNPRGNVGGELYINELEAIEGALRRRNN